jgi:hypothetical protein
MVQAVGRGFGVGRTDLPQARLSAIATPSMISEWTCLAQSSSSGSAA